MPSSTAYPEVDPLDYDFFCTSPANDAAFSLIPPSWPALDGPVTVELYRPQSPGLYYEDPAQTSVPQPPKPRSSSSSPADRSADHVPRPRNAFMLFRAKFLEDKKISEKVEHDHRHISRIIAHCWHSLPEDERKHWHRKAEQEKALHKQKYPSYRFTPVSRERKPVKRKTKRNGETELKRCKVVADLIQQGKSGKDLEEALENLGTPAAEKHKDTAVSSPMPVMVNNDAPPNPVPTKHFCSRSPVFRSPLLPPFEGNMPLDLASESPMPSELAPYLIPQYLHYPPHYLPRNPWSDQQYNSNISMQMPMNPLYTDSFPSHTIYHYPPIPSTGIHHPQAVQSNHVAQFFSHSLF